MSAISTYRSRSIPMKKTGRLWRSVVLILATVLATVMVVATQAQATRILEPVLMKGETILQDGIFYYGTSHVYKNGSWNTYYADGSDDYPRAAVVGAGRKLHIRLNKAQRPDRFTIKDHETGRHLKTTLRRVQRDGKTVAWDVYFRVNRPNHDYFLDTRGVWKHVPGTHTWYGHTVYLFHVKTAD